MSEGVQRKNSGGPRSLESVAYLEDPSQWERIRALPKERNALFLKAVLTYLAGLEVCTGLTALELRDRLNELGHQFPEGVWPSRALAKSPSLTKTCSLKYQLRPEVWKQLQGATHEL